MIVLSDKQYDEGIATTALLGPHFERTINGSAARQRTGTRAIISAVPEQQRFLRLGKKLGRQLQERNSIAAHEMFQRWGRNAQLANTAKKAAPT